MGKSIRVSLAENARPLIFPSSLHSQGEEWRLKLARTGFDGVVAKKLDEPYRLGERTEMVKVKRIRTPDWVVGGFRYSEKGGGIGSLLLGLYNQEGRLDHVGFNSSFNLQERKKLTDVVGTAHGPRLDFLATPRGAEPMGNASFYGLAAAKAKASV
jgi:ATP-dependent DNA ligase